MEHALCNRCGLELLAAGPCPNCGSTARVEVLSHEEARAFQKDRARHGAAVAVEAPAHSRGRTLPAVLFLLGFAFTTAGLGLLASVAVDRTYALVDEGIGALASGIALVAFALNRQRIA